MNKTILVDVDDTVLDLMSEWLRRYNRDWNDNVQKSDVLSWELHKYLKPECGRDIYNYLNDKDLYFSVKPIEGALEGCQRIRDLGYRIVFVTAFFNTPKVEAMHDYGFLKEYPYNDGRWNTCCDMVMANDKTLIKGDCIIDDKVDNIEKFGSGYLFDQPWNKNSNLLRFTNWDYAAGYFEFERSL